MLLLVGIVQGRIQDPKLPVPEAADQKRAELDVRGVFKDEFAKKDRDSRRALGQKLLAQAACWVICPYSLRSRKKARTYPSASVTSKPHSPSSMNDNFFTNDAPRWLNSSKSASGSRV